MARLKTQDLHTVAQIHDAKNPLLLAVQFLAHSIALLPHYLYCTTLFTFSDVKTILIPQTLLGLLSAFSLSTTSLSPLALLPRLPHVLAWVYLNLLPFNISNQSAPASVAEDALNKPWRPLPAGLLSRSEARTMMLAGYAAAFGLSAWHLGGAVPCLALVALGYWYNRLGGADRSCVTRNAINAAGYTSFGVGATQVALGSDGRSGNGGSSKLDASVAWPWFALLAAVVFSSVHAQDMPDQDGDRARGRRTVPLVLGDGAARGTIAAAVGAWSVVVPLFWAWMAGGVRMRLREWWAEGSCSSALGLFLAFAGAQMALGLFVAWRFLARRGVLEDKRSFRLWNVWVVGLYAFQLANRW